MYVQRNRRSTVGALHANFTTGSNVKKKKKIICNQTGGTYNCDVSTGQCYCTASNDERWCVHHACMFEEAVQCSKDCMTSRVCCSCGCSSRHVTSLGRGGGDDGVLALQSYDTANPSKVTGPAYPVMYHTHIHTPTPVCIPVCIFYIICV